MKKNLLIMMMMVLCAGFVSAQTINTVRGFVPGGSTGADDNATYVVIGQPFSMMSVANADAQAEVMVGLAQMQLITDTTMTVVGYKDGYHEHGLDLNAQELLEALDDLSTCSNGEVEGYMGFLNFQKPNLAHNNDNFEYYYDSLFVVKVFICPDSTTDAAGNKYEVIALNEKCWINSNLRTTVACGGGSVEGMIYNSELNEVTEDMLPTYGMLYTFAAATGAANNADGVQCDEETGYLQGICPCNWHLPTAEEMAPLFVLPAENLRVNGNWIVEGNNNLTGFSAEPAGFYNATFDRFEGLLTETDYWMVNCDSLENPVQDVFQLIYSCNTPLKPKHSTDDALSVRCVYDIVREFDNCENPTPQPTPPPTPSECSLSVTVQPSTTSAKSITGTVTGTLVNIAEATVSVTSYTVLNAVEPVEVDPAQTYPLTVNQQDGTFSWTYAPENMGDQLQAITGYVTVIGNTATCGDEKEFNTAPQVEPVCPEFDTDYDVQQVGITSVTAKILNFDPSKIQEIQVEVGITSSDPDDQDLAIDPQSVNLDDINADGVFTWTLPDGAKPLMNGLITSMSGQFTIIPNDPEECDEDEIDFQTELPACDFTVGQANYSNGVGTVQVTNYSTDYFNNDTSAYIAVYHGIIATYYDNTDYPELFNKTTNENITTLSFTLPSTASVDGADSIEFFVQLTVKEAYSHCAEDDFVVINRSVTTILTPTTTEPGFMCPSLGNISDGAGELTVPIAYYNSDFFISGEEDVYYIIHYTDNTSSNEIRGASISGTGTDIYKFEYSTVADQNKTVQSIEFNIGLSLNQYHLDCSSNPGGTYLNLGDTITIQ